MHSIFDSRWELNLNIETVPEDDSDDELDETPQVHNTMHLNIFVYLAACAKQLFQDELVDDISLDSSMISLLDPDYSSEEEESDDDSSFPVIPTQKYTDKIQ